MEKEQVFLYSMPPWAAGASGLLLLRAKLTPAKKTKTDVNLTACSGFDLTKGLCSKRQHSNLLVANLPYQRCWQNQTFISIPTGKRQGKIMLMMVTSVQSEPTSIVKLQHFFPRFFENSDWFIQVLLLLWLVKFHIMQRLNFPLQCHKK